MSTPPPAPLPNPDGGGEGEAGEAEAAAAAAPAAVLTFTSFFRIMCPRLLALSLRLIGMPTAADTDAVTVADSTARGEADGERLVEVVVGVGVTGTELAPLADRRFSSSMRSLREGRRA